MVLKEILKIFLDEINFKDLSVPNYSLNILANFKYARILIITSVDIKHSLLSYKYILTNHHHNFTELNMVHTFLYNQFTKLDY